MFTFTLYIKILYICIFQGSGIREEYSVWQCYDSGSPSFVLDLIIFIYLTLLQIVGIILAFQTRKVKITVLNDSKSVATLIYISSVVLIVIVLIKFFLRNFINVSAAVFSGGILLLATFYLILIFCPKVIVLCIILRNFNLCTSRNTQEHCCSQITQLKFPSQEVHTTYSQMSNAHIYHLRRTLRAFVSEPTYSCRPHLNIHIKMTYQKHMKE